MRKPLLGFCALALLSPSVGFSAEAGGTRMFALPGAAYLEGVGPVYGGAAGARNVFTGHTDLIAFKTFGEVRAGGIAVRDRSLFGTKVVLDAGFGILEEADFLTTYAREYGQRLAVRQVIKGHALGFRFGYEPIPERLSLSAGYAFSLVKFVDYKTRGGTVIPFDKSDLHDVNTNVLSLGAGLHLIAPEKDGAGPLTLRSKLSAVAGRAGQSDLGLIDLRLGGERELGRDWAIAYTTQLQRTVLLREAGSSAVDGKCSTAADPSLRRQCAELESDLTRFIAQSNRKGTGVPLGGSQGLRSYREMRFKAANTALSGVEVRWRAPVKLPAWLVVFYELGHAADGFSAIYARSRHSAGLGARVVLGGVPIRAEFASGHEGQAAFLTFGRPW